MRCCCLFQDKDSPVSFLPQQTICRISLSRETSLSDYYLPNLYDNHKAIIEQHLILLPRNPAAYLLIKKIYNKVYLLYNNQAKQVETQNVP